MIGVSAIHDVHVEARRGHKAVDAFSSSEGIRVDF